MQRFQIAYARNFAFVKAKYERVPYLLIEDLEQLVLNAEIVHEDRGLHIQLHLVVVLGLFYH